MAVTKMFRKLAGKTTPEVVLPTGVFEVRRANEDGTETTIPFDEAPPEVQKQLSKMRTAIEAAMSAVDADDAQERAQAPENRLWCGSCVNAVGEQLFDVMPKTVHAEITAGKAAAFMLAEHFCHAADKPVIAAMGYGDAQGVVDHLVGVMHTTHGVIPRGYLRAEDLPPHRREASSEESVARAARSQFTADEAPIVEHTRHGAFPIAADVDAAMRSGMCDSTELVGEVVLYETDRRGGKSYFLPAIVTCVVRTHPDLPFLRAWEENGEPGGEGVQRRDDGIYVEENPVPIPRDGTLHLKVLTPGPQGTYDEFSVPYDPTGATPCSWRHRPGAGMAAPF